MSEARRLEPPDLEAIVTDRHELSKGARYYQAGGLRHLARFRRRLFAEAAGANRSHYRVRVDLDDDSERVQGRCTCMAARSRPFCKHAAALLWAWVSEPDAFVASERAPAEQVERRRHSIRKGKRTSEELMADGIELTDTLVRELGVVGVASLSGERVAELARAGEMLREHRLRRLSARCLDLGAMLDAAPSRPIDEIAYTELLTDMLLTVARLRRHLAGESLADHYVEELVGRTWRKRDRRPIGGLELCEIAYLRHTTSDDFEIRQSRFIDVQSGQQYSEKQILPRVVARRTRGKRSYRGVLLVGVTGTLFPGFPPLRLALESRADETPLNGEHLTRLLSVCEPSAKAAVRSLVEHRRDRFAPPRLPIALRSEALLARGQHLELIDAEGATVHLPAGEMMAQEIATLVARGPIVALIGDLATDLVVPVLHPLAALLRVDGRLELCPLAPAVDAPLPRVSSRALGGFSGNSRVATSLGEMRQELAQACVGGLAGLSERGLEPLTARLGEIGLRPAAVLLERIGKAADPANRVSEFVKLFHLLDLALLQLVGAGEASRADLVPVPGWRGVMAKRASDPLQPAEVWELERKGEIGAPEAAVLLAAHLGATSTDLLCDDLSLWANAATGALISAEIASRGPAVVHRALGRALDYCERATQIGRVASLTALAVIERFAGGNQEVGRALWSMAQAARRGPNGSTLAGLFLDTLSRLRAGGELEALAERRNQLLAAELPGALHDLANAADKQQRTSAAYVLAAAGTRAAIPALRAAFRFDTSREVRQQAALALAQLGDTGLLPTFLAAMESGDEGETRIAVAALGWLGDARAIEPLLSAALRGLKPVLATEALARAPALALEPLLDRLEAEPTLARRKSLVGLASGLPAPVVLSSLRHRIDRAPLAELGARSSAYLAVGDAADVSAQVAATLLERLGQSDHPAAARARRRAERWLSSGRRKPK
jgi:HEAT repeat protein